jgi:hypothetical protein
VERFSGNFLDLVVGEIDDLEVLAVVDDAEDVPVQEGDVVAVENEHLGSMSCF